MSVWKMINLKRLQVGEKKDAKNEKRTVTFDKCKRKSLKMKGLIKYL